VGLGVWPVGGGCLKEKRGRKRLTGVLQGYNFQYDSQAERRRRQVPGQPAVGSSEVMGSLRERRKEDAGFSEASKRDSPITQPNAVNVCWRCQYLLPPPRGERRCRRADPPVCFRAD
jgi:hypothetical protein